MAATIVNSQYFDTLSDLSLTPSQEAELDLYIPMTKRVCNRFFRKNYEARHDFSTLDSDDLAQMALVRLILAIKHDKAKGLQDKDKENYYTKLVTRSCLSQIRSNRVRGNGANHADLFECANFTVDDDSDTINTRLYLNTLLSKLRGKYTEWIIRNYYGLGTAPVGPTRMSEILPLTAAEIATRRHAGINRLKGIHITWATSN